MTKKTLSQLCPLEHGTVISLETADHLRRRLQDIGFTKGTVVQCLFKSPLGDPTAYRVKETTVALRFEEASKILIE